MVSRCDAEGDGRRESHLVRLTNSNVGPREAFFHRSHLESELKIAGNIEEELDTREPLL